MRGFIVQAHHILIMLRIWAKQVAHMEENGLVGTSNAGYHSRDIVVHERTSLKQILKEENGRYGLDSSGLE
jgi:hypothetical protein